MEENNDFNEISEVNFEQPSTVQPANQSVPPHSFVSQMNLSVTKSISGWATFRAVIDIIYGGFTCLSGVFLVFLSLIFFAAGRSGFGSPFNNTQGLNNFPPEIALGYGITFIISGIIYPVIGVFIILAGAKLLKTVDNLKMAVSANDDEKINMFLNSLSKFFKLNSISSIIKISLSIGMFILFIVLVVISINVAGDISSQFGNFQ